MIDIVLVTFYKDICLDKTLTSIKNTTKYPYRLWVFDNKSPRTPYIKDILFKHKDIITGAWLCDGNYITAPYWWAYINVIDKKSKYFIMTEGDVVIPDNRGCWITRSLEILENEKTIGLVSIRTKYHSPDDSANYVSWYNSWKPYKEYKDIFECDLVLWHNLVIRKSIIDNWVLTENYNYFWYDGLFRSKIKQSGYSCVGLGWDAYHYASNESIALYPDYTNFIGASIFNNKYVITDKNLTKII